MKKKTGYSQFDIEAMKLIACEGRRLSTEEIAELTGYGKRTTSGLSMSLGRSAFLCKDMYGRWGLSKQCKLLIQAIRELCDIDNSQFENL